MQRRSTALALAAFGLVFVLACQVGNQNPNTPVISATATTVESGAVVGLTVSCTDPDGNALTFAWCASGGTFDATTGTAVNWTAPTVTATTVYTVRVIADDGNGGSSHGSIQITVEPGTGPGGDEVIVGRSETESWTPFQGGPYDHTRVQFLYLGSEVNRTGTVTKLWMMPSAQQQGTYNSFEIYLCPTTRTVLEDSFHLNYEGATPTRVYQRATQSYGNTEQKDYWHEFDFDTDWNYTGGNFIVEVRWSGDSDRSISSHAYPTGSDYRQVLTTTEGRETGLTHQQVIYLKLTFEN
ncbi:hypothetical protein JXB37_07685 [candidate division WOR-3 bacterium]|nr:hypothetical protein [candidate division WOR-3 bacterium]